MFMMTNYNQYYHYMVIVNNTQYIMVTTTTHHYPIIPPGHQTWLENEPEKVRWFSKLETSIQVGDFPLPAMFDDTRG